MKTERPINPKALLLANLKTAQFYLHRAPFADMEEFISLRREIDRCLPALEVMPEVLHTQRKA